MAETKTSDEKIAELEEKIKVLKARKRQIQNKENAEKRKARTHRLIQIGSLVEKYADGEIDLDKFERYCSQYSGALKAYVKEEIKEEKGTNPLSL